MEESENQGQQEEKEVYAFLKAKSWSEKDPDFRAPYEVLGNKEVDSSILQLLQPVNAWRVSSGRTPVEQDAEHPDRFSDILHDVSLSVHMDKPTLHLSKYDIQILKDEYGEFAKSKGYDEDKIAEDRQLMEGFTSLLEMAITKRWTQGNKEPMPDNYVPNWWQKAYERVNRKLKKM